MSLWCSIILSSFFLSSFFIVLIVFIVNIPSAITFPMYSTQANRNVGKQTDVGSVKKLLKGLSWYFSCCCLFFLFIIGFCCTGVVQHLIQAALAAMGFLCKILSTQLHYMKRCLHWLPKGQLCVVVLFPLLLFCDAGPRDRACVGSALIYFEARV